jgi:hypothetical protein
MLSKCANPDCSEEFRYLHQGKIFFLSPTPEVEAVVGDSLNILLERFWLCDRCCREMTMVWDGTQAKVVPLLDRGPARGTSLEEKSGTRRVRKHSAAAMRHHA